MFYADVRFCDDPIDIASVKVELARFVHVYVGDATLTQTALAAANQAFPTVESEFAVFQRIKLLKRQKHKATREFQTQTVTRFLQRLSQAVVHHDKAISSKSQLFSQVIRLKRGASSDVSDLRSVGATIATFVKHSKQANAAYRALLRGAYVSHLLPKAFQHFCTDVLGDTELGERYA